MIALLLAAQISAAAAPGARVLTPFLPPYRASCPRPQVEQAAGGPVTLYRPQRQGAVRAQRLSELPKANHEIAINRMVDGCPKPVIVSYQVGR